MLSAIAHGLRHKMLRAIVCSLMLSLLLSAESWRPSFALRAAGFLGTLKEVPADFLVIEDLSLMHLDLVVEQVAPVEASPITEQEVLDLREWLCGLLGAEQMSLVAQIASGDSADSSLTTLRILPALDKDSRTLLHQRLRAVYPAIESKTDMANGGDEATLIQVYMSKSSKKQRRWDASRPDYLHFTAQKTLLSTTELINELSRSMGLLPSRFGYAGSKDKRATTVQRLSVWRPDKAVPTLIRAKNLDLRCYDVSPSKQKVQVGNLRGNFFCATLRGAGGGSEGAESAHEAAARLLVSGTRPFVNYFGPQRFGAPLPINAVVGSYLLSSQYDRAVLMLLLSPSSKIEVESGLTLSVLQSWLEGDWRGELVEKWRAHAGRVSAMLTKQQQQQQQQGQQEQQGEGEEEVREVGDPVEDAAMEEGGDALMGDQERSSGSTQQSSSGSLSDVSAHPQMQRLAMVTALLEGRGSVAVPRRTPFELKQLVKGIVFGMQRKAEVCFSEPLSTTPAPSERFASLDFQQVFNGAYSKQLKLLFVNALQSDMFNAAAKERAERGQLEYAEEGDCVLVADGQGLRQWDASGLDLTAGKAEWDLEGQAGKGKSVASLHLVSAREAQERTYSAEAVVLPLPGSSTFPSGGLVLPVTDRTASLFRLPGAYRFFLSTARNVAAVATVASGLEVPVPAPSPSDTEGDAFSTRVAELYATGRMQTLLVSLLQSSLEFGAPPDEGVALRVVFSLPASTYATTFLGPFTRNTNECS